MTDLFELAQNWLEHCREQAEYFELQDEDDTAEKWHNEAEDAEKAIKRAIDLDSQRTEALIAMRNDLADIIRTGEPLDAEQAGYMLPHLEKLIPE